MSLSPIEWGKGKGMLSFFAAAPCGSRGRPLAFLHNGKKSVILPCVPSGLRDGWGVRGAFVFSVGDKVLYPMHGAGVIERIEEREVLGETARFYVITLPFGDMMVSIPVDRNQEVGLRPVIEEKKARRILDEFGLKQIKEDDNWSRRYRDNMLRIKSGNIEEVSSVLFLLMKRERDRGLSTGERKMMVSARQIFVSEISLAIGSSGDEVERRLAQSLV